MKDLLEGVTADDCKILKIKGYSLNNLLEAAYKFGKHDEYYAPEEDRWDKSLSMLWELLEAFPSFNELNSGDE
jgi:hypothetical protein